MPIIVTEILAEEGRGREILWNDDRAKFSAAFKPFKKFSYRDRFRSIE